MQIQLLLLLTFFHTHHFPCHVLVLVLVVLVVAFGNCYFFHWLLWNKVLTKQLAVFLLCCLPFYLSLCLPVCRSTRPSACRSVGVFGAVNHSSNAVSPCCSYCCYCRPIINIAAIVIVAVVAAVIAAVVPLYSNFCQLSLCHSWVDVTLNNDFYLHMQHVTFKAVCGATDCQWKSSPGYSFGCKNTNLHQQP